MARKKQTPIKRNRRTRHDKVLHLKVTSPRIVFFQSLKAMRGMVKTVIILGIIGTGLVMGYKMITKHFNDNEEFVIKFLPVTDFEGNKTVVLSQARIWEISEIDLKGTIFTPNLGDVRQRLKDRAEIIDAEVNRKLPHTITIKIKERIPVAWLSCQQLGLAGRSQFKGLLLDEYGVSFKSEKGFWGIAKDLPVIEIKTANKHEFPVGKKMNHADAMRALSFVNTLNKIGGKTWAVDRVVVENFYTLRVICSDELEARFSMHLHQQQLSKLINARTHAAKIGEEIAWIDLRPKVNIPFQYKSGSTKQQRIKISAPIPERSGMDSTTRSILDRDS